MGSERVEKGVARVGEPAHSSAAWVLHTWPASSRASRMVPNGRGKPGGLGQLCFCSGLQDTAGLKARCSRERRISNPAMGPAEPPSRATQNASPHSVAVQRASLLRPWGELGSPAAVLQLWSVCPKLRKGPQSAGFAVLTRGSHRAVLGAPRAPRCLQSRKASTGGPKGAATPGSGD